MSEIASRSQLRMSFVRVTAVVVPLILLLGFGSGLLAPSGEENRWYGALAKPSFTPPGWVFPIAWTTLYILIGLALSMVIHARGARGRSLAVGLFVAQLVLNFAWSPLFFGFHQVTIAFWVIIVMLMLAITATVLFARIRGLAAALMVPYLLWLAFAGVLTFTIDQMNPGAETLVPPAQRTKIVL